MESMTVRHNVEKEPPSQGLFNEVQWFQMRRFKCESLRRMDDRHQVMAKVSTLKI